MDNFFNNEEYENSIKSTLCNCQNVDLDYIGANYNISELKYSCSLYDCKELKQLIINNPNLPLLLFAGEDAYSGEWCYETQPNNCNYSIKELTLYKDMWVDKDDYEDKLREDCEDMEEFSCLTDEGFFNMIEQKIKETKFIKVICVYVG